MTKDRKNLPRRQVIQGLAAASLASPLAISRVWAAWPDKPGRSLRSGRCA
jgi:hypothetical protein